MRLGSLTLSRDGFLQPRNVSLVGGGQERRIKPGSWGPQWHWIFKSGEVEPDTRNLSIAVVWSSNTYVGR